jgi:hypothetical protein
MTQEYPMSRPRWEEDEWRRRSYPERYRPPASGLLTAGLVAAGVLGALAWYYFGPDLRRYLKIQRM